MQWLAAICVKRPVFASVIVLVFVVIGIAGYNQLSVDRFPKVNAPTVTITTTLSGASPEEMDTEVTDIIEESVNTISGIDDLSSVSSEGSSVVTLSFVFSKNIDVAAQEVRDRVNRIQADLPKDIDQPKIEKMDPDAAAILVLALVADRPVREITEYADKVLRRQLESVSGVGSVTIIGGRKRQINVWLDPLRLQAHGLTAIDVKKAIGDQNVQIPSGSMKNTLVNQNLRVVGKAQSVEELSRLVVREKEGVLVRLCDVARVEDGAQEAETAARRNGVSSVVLSIRRQSGENIMSVVEAIKERLGDIQKQLPGGYRIEQARDSSSVIKTSTGIVKEHLVLGAVLAALVVLIFLGNSRATIISALAIPTSLISTFGIMWATDQTINEISLVALALAVGIVIDDTIIVVENIYKHIEERHTEPFKAAVDGTKEIGLAVLATTLSLLAVFIPVVFLGGMVGQMLKSFGLTMSFAIAISLLVSFTLAPSLAARLFQAQGRSKLDRWLENLVDLFYRPLERSYLWLLGHALNRRWVVVLLAIATIFACGPLLKMVGKDMMPPNEEAQCQVTLRAPEGTSLQATELMADRVTRALRSMSGVESTLLTIGDDSQATINKAAIYVRLIAPDKRKEKQSEIIERIRRDLAATIPPNVRSVVSEVSPLGSGDSPAAQYVISGPSLEKLAEVANAVLLDIKKLPGIRDVDSTLISGKPEVAITADRSKAGSMGVSMSDLSTTLQILVAGVEVSTYNENGEDYKIRLRADEEYRNSPEALSRVTVPTSSGSPASLMNVVQLKSREGPSQVNRLNRRREVTITAGAAPGVSQQTVLDGIDQIVKRQNLSSDYYAGPSSMSKEMTKTFSRFVTAFGMAFVFMYLILAAQFESWVHPFTILITLPLTLPFALLSLILLGQSLNIFSALGLLVLFGVVKKNGILQIDHTNQLRAGGMPKREAILLANKDRLRPILMTTAAFVAGMIPMFLSRGIGSAYHNATAGIVVGGQTLSLVLTLVAIPVFYSLLDDLASWFHTALKAHKAPASASTTPTPSTSLS